MSEDKTKNFKTADGFTNFVSRLGINPITPRGEDNNISDSFYSFNLITRNRIQLEAAYRGSWLVGKIVDAVAEDMTRAGIKVSSSEGQQNLNKLYTGMSRLQIWQSFSKLIKWSRLYGGSIGVLQIEGQSLDMPLMPDLIEKGQFKGISVYDRWQLNPDLTRLITVGPDLGLPEYYSIVLGLDSNADLRTSTGQIVVHHSRCIRAIGHELPYFQAITEMMWGESIVERLWDRLISFDSTSLSVANLVDRARLRTVGIDGLRDIIAAGGPAYEGLIEMFEMVRKFQTNEGITLLDKNDTFSSDTYQFGGLSDIILQFAQQVSGAADIPLIRLFTQSPAGLNATGDNDMRMYYDNINAWQEARMRNPMEVVIKVLYRSLFGEAQPEDLQFEFVPLWQMTAVDKANIAKTNSDTIIGAHSAGLIDTPTAMEELRSSSSEHGIFSNITDEAIEEAKTEEPPLPDQAPITDPQETPSDTPKTPDTPEAEEAPKLSVVKSGDDKSSLVKFFGFGGK